MPTPRPYGRGPYGTGPYSRYAGVVYEVGGASTLSFGARALGAERIVHAWALTQIAFDAWSEHLTPNWAAPPPCAPGEWIPAAPCEAGSWSAPGPCSTGSWAPRRLVGQ